MLQAHPDIDTVFAASDLMALGAIEAIAAAGKTGKIRVVGFDALDDAKKAIAAGTMDASVAQFPYEMGKAAVESAVKVMRGEKLPADIMVKLEMVTKDTSMKRLNVGVIGLGRLGRVYARDLAGRIPETRLVAVADPMGNLAKEIAEEFDVPKSYTDPLALIDDKNVDAIVIVTPTHIHREQVIAAAARKKPTFCEKPPALSLAEVAEMKTADREVRHVLPDGLHAPLRRRLCGGEEGRSTPAASACRWSSRRRRAIRSARASSTPTRRAAAAC